MARIELGGSIKYLTANPAEYFEVSEGTVYVYVVKACGIHLGRSMFLCEMSEGDKIPTLSLADNELHESYHFLITAKGHAILEAKRFKTENETETESKEDTGLKDETCDTVSVDDVRDEFIKKNDCFKESEERFSITLLNWYKGKLADEEHIINQFEEEKKRSNIEKERLIMSLFTRGHKLNYESSTDLLLYNTLSVYCDYMNIPMCSYQVLEGAYGIDFSIEDIARISHFVVRRTTLPENWYKSDVGAFIGFKKDNGKPVLCVPKRSGRYIIYDLDLQRDYLVNADAAEMLSDTAYVAYSHLPQGKITLKDVIKFGIKRWNTSDIVNYLVLYVLITLVGLLLPFLNQILYDQLIPLGMQDSIIEIGCVILACMMGNVFFTLVRNLASFRGMKNMEYTIVAATYDRIFKLPQKFIEKFGTMELINRVNSISGVFSQTVSSGLSAILGSVLALFYLWRMFDESRPLAWRALIFSVISGAVTYLFGRLRARNEKSRLEASTKANGMLYQFIAGILKIKVSGIENRSLLEFEKANVDSLNCDIKSTKISNVGGLVSAVISTFITGFIYFTVINKKQELTLGDYAAFNSAYGMFSSAIGQLIGYFLTRASLTPVLERIRPIFNEECEITDKAGVIGKMEGTVEVSHLDFAYDDDSVQVLSDINLKINPGEFIGIVGPSGCGKSTLLKCMLGFENPKKGKIYFDNKDIETLDKCEVRRQVGVVLQDGKLLTGNIFSNVTLAAPNMTASEVEDLLKEVGLYEDVEKMPMGVFTGISEGGGTVSGGQQQRILIARALANNPAMVFFDEATSALDNVTQQKVCESLEARKMTRIMIAHRLSTVVNCDRIYVMDAGRIVESGNYEELMKNKGLFYELAVRQKVEAV